LAEGSPKPSQEEVFDYAALSDEEHQEVADMGMELGDDMKTAYRIYMSQVEETAEQVESWFGEGLAELQKENGRRIVPSEEAKLREWPAQAPEGATLADGWEQLYGKKYSQEERDQLRERYERNKTDYEYKFQHELLDARKRIEKELQAEREETGTYSPANPRAARRGVEGREQPQGPL
jgi:hypothetical protein